ncbi:hypothetical protein MAPG_09171 [Magnaporthiopsis poae ATCC 64411]|uniref:Uncharacterized protein n=1 Tax=Magnaporthiopsis poae (strain ATCC 64411 / 73-15) TaxID=644358 RepID=A0A0C4E992_MAGP6|nr:hypothetical protein MAPG_09171 [Magnaporthiopsis poae ATCC 64411]
MDRTMHPRAGNPQGTAVKELLLHLRIPQRTHARLEPASSIGGQKKDGKLAATAAGDDDDLEEPYKPLSTLYFGISSKHDGPLPPAATSAAAAAKVNPKTSGDCGHVFLHGGR